MPRKKKRVGVRSPKKKIIQTSPQNPVPEVLTPPVESPKPFRHKVRKPLLLIIASLVIILIIGGWYFTFQYEPLVGENEGGPFFVDHAFVKVLLTESQSAQREIQITNSHTTAQVFELLVGSLEGVVTTDTSLFTLEPSQTKIINLGFSAFNQDEGVKQGLGIHLGELIISANREKKRIPLIVEIESVNVKFDANLHPLTVGRELVAGSEANVEVRMFDLSTSEIQNVEMTYDVEDVFGNSLFTESETVVVQGQTSLLKTVPIPQKAKEGFYVFKSIARVGDSVGTSSYVFQVVDPKKGAPSQLISFCKDDGFCITLSITFILLILFVIIYFILFFGVLIWYRMVKMVTLSPEKRWELEEEERLWRMKEQEWREQQEEKKEKRKLELERLRFEMKEKEELERFKLQLEEKKLRDREQYKEKREQLQLKEEREKLRKLEEEHPRKVWDHFVKVQKKQTRKPATVEEKIKREEEKLKKELHIKKPPLFVRLGIVKSEEEKKRIKEEKVRKKKELFEQRRKKELEEQKQKEAKRLEEAQLQQDLEKRRKEEEARVQREEVKQRKEGERLRKAEEAKRKREERLLQAKEKKRLREEAKRREDEERQKQEERALLEKARKQEEELQQMEEERKKREKVEQRKKAERVKKPLFSFGKPVNQEVLKRSKGKSKTFRKHLEHYHQALDHVKEGNHKEAKKHYVQARNHYLNLEYEEKKEVYKDLDNLYKDLKKKE